MRGKRHEVLLTVSTAHMNGKSSPETKKVKYLFWCNVPYCATKIDIAPENPDTTTVSGFFRAHFFECKYYNDQFDLHEGDMVFVSGKLTGECGIVDTVNYKFKINLADYERVIAHPVVQLHGTYAPVLDKMVSYAFHSGQPLC